MSIKNTIRKTLRYLKEKRIISIPKVVQADEMLAGKTVLITGGSGGIGMAIAAKALSVGANVIICGRNEGKLMQCLEVLNYPAEKLRYLVLDVEQVSTFEGKINEASKMFDEPISILVNSAGIIAKHSFLETSVDEFDEVFNTNVRGTYFICQTLAKYWIRSNIQGRILNVSSSSALRPAWGPYQMSKWAIRGFTVGLADLLLPHNIVVNAIAPGPTATSMLGMNDPEDLALPTSPIKRYTTPEEIAELAVVLISDLGSIVIGDTLYATGGSGVISLHK